MRQYLLLLFSALALLLTAPAQTSAQDFEKTVAALAAKSFSAKIRAAEAVAETGDERAAAVLKAMLEGLLYTDKNTNKVFIVRKSGSAFLLTDPLTAQEAGQAPRASVKKITVNNRLRNVLKGVFGGLTLLSKDPDVRLAAARSVFKAPNETVQKPLELAISRETDKRVAAELARALAAVQLLHSADGAVRLAAVSTLGGHATADIRAFLSSVIQDEKDPAVKQAAVAALAAVESKLAFWNGVTNVFQGLSLGSVLLLAAVGLAITFGVMGVINMAHGELVMIGAYTTFVVQEVFRAFAPAYFDFSIIAAIPLAFLVSGLFGVAIERGIIRFLYGRPLETLLATWGLSLILQQLMRTIFGPTNQDVGAPSWMSGSIELTGGLVLTFNRLWIIFFSLAVLGLLVLLLKKTAFGLQMRAVTQNRRMASSMGIRTGWVDAMTFGLGSGIAGVAGVALSQIDNVSPNLGQNYIIDSFMVVVFGGVGNLWGTLVGAFTLGIANKFLEPVTGTVLAKILVLVAIILFIQKRPRGLFALKGRAVEA